MMDYLTSRICELSKNQPDKIAVAFKQESLTYMQLYKKTCGICSWLINNGLHRGDRVCFSAVSKPEMVAIYLGCQMAGIVSVFLDKNATPEHMANIYRISEASLLLTDKPMKEYSDGIRIETLRGVYSTSCDCDILDCVKKNNEDDLSEILFTSGTTGKPKGVMLSYKSVYNILMNTIKGVGYSEKTILVLPLPLNHSFALRVLRAILYCGGTIILQNGFTFAKETENNINNYGCNALACVPASYEILKGQMQNAFKDVMSKLDSIEVGAGSLSAGQRKEIVDLLPDVRIYNVWGSSESGGALFCNVTEAVKSDETIGTLGSPIAGRIDVALLKDDTPFNQFDKFEGKLSEWFIDTNSEQPGRMAIRGDMQMMGYWREPDMTAATIIDGWLITGDIAYKDKNGNIFMLGRADDIINMGGEKVSPVETENIISQYDYIRDCACIGVCDELLGQIPVLFVVTGLGYDENKFQKWMAGKIERTKLPQKIITIDEIPRNRMKKINREELKKLWDSKDSLNLVNPVVDAILSRRSIRKFTDKEIKKEILDMILKCGYYAPSGHNMQSWRFTVLTCKEDIDKLKIRAKEAADKNSVVMYGFENPKVIILISNDNRNKTGCQDASCAAENIMLAAQSYGIGSVWLNVLMKLRGEEPVKSLLDEFEVPKNHTVWAAIALGYPVTEGVRLQKKTDVVRVY